jgi:hypothetical protein
LVSRRQQARGVSRSKATTSTDTPSSTTLDMQVGLNPYTIPWLHCDTYMVWFIPIRLGQQCLAHVQVAVACLCGLPAMASQTFGQELFESDTGSFSSRWGARGPSSGMPFPGGLGAISQALEGKMA